MDADLFIYLIYTYTILQITYPKPQFYILKS